jgi:hypothetical protein
VNNLKTKPRAMNKEKHSWSVSSSALVAAKKAVQYFTEDNQDKEQARETQALKLSHLPVLTSMSYDPSSTSPRRYVVLYSR